MSTVCVDTRLNCTFSVELRGIEPLTFSMRTRRATNCAIAPWSPVGYQPAQRCTYPATVLLAGRPRQVVAAAEPNLVEMFEDRILVVDVQNHRTGPT